MTKGKSKTEVYQKDQVFNLKFSKVSDFKFGTNVAFVFDDMVNRSVPFYEEIQRMVAELAAEHSFEGSRIYDLGCSTGTTLIYMDQVVPANIEFVGMDDSEAMLEKCREKLSVTQSKREFELRIADISEEIDVDRASVVVLCLTLQFVRPINRERLLQQIFDGLQPGGVLILVEKILAEDNEFNREFIKYYYDMKRRHNYTEMEISQKREALENVLIPYKLSENIRMLGNAGFDRCEVFFKWYNFAGIIAKKVL